jgi:predicted O-methyltransferase YrrM
MEGVRIAQALISYGKKKGVQQIKDYQAMLLYGLAGQYNDPGDHILELGTYYGFSAAVMKLAAPACWLDTLNPAEWETEAASKNLAPLDRCAVWTMASWDALEEDRFGPELSLVFVDGYHNAVARDVPWFNQLRTDGLMLFHDYVPGTAKVQQCEPVYRAVNDLVAHLGRPPDVLLVDDQEFGMAGFYRREGEHAKVG